MFKQFRLWRARRQMKRRLYKIDRRIYRGVFGPGFFAFLGGTRFWEASNHQRSNNRLVRKLTLLAILAGLGALGWILLVSVRALNTFN